MIAMNSCQKEIQTKQRNGGFEPSGFIGNIQKRVAETSGGTEAESSQVKTPVPTCMWSQMQSFSDLAVLLQVTFPTPPRGPGNSVRLATPEVGLIKSLFANSYSRNKRKWKALGIYPEIP
ncbi:Hairy/Enhancer-Of-Split Related With Yrpw Motif-Like Protein [Manis pentadactyla]|nr:Hairy/Enhancer-Of-Split Related With Yrpw Motif-Like Protein [Manis pentadactyla]